MTDEINNVPSTPDMAQDNTKVKLRLQPVLPVMMLFYCECTTPPTELPGPHTMLPSDPPKYQHQCPNCKKQIVLNHASGAVVFQKINKPDEVPKLVVAQSLPS